MNHKIGMCNLRTEFPELFLKMFQTEFFRPFLTNAAYISESLDFFHGLGDIAWFTVRVNENTSFAIEDCFFESAIIDTDNRSTTGHRFHWTHTKVFIDGDINGSNRFLYERTEFFIIG